MVKLPVERGIFVADYILEKLTVGAGRAPVGIDSALGSIIAGKLKTAPEKIDYQILGKSIDSRKEPVIIYKLLISSNEKLDLPLASPEVSGVMKKAELPRVSAIPQIFCKEFFTLRNRRPGFLLSH